MLLPRLHADQLDLLQYQFRQILDAATWPTRAHTHTRARIRWDQGSDRFRPNDSRRILVLGRGGRANRMQARHEFLFSRSSKYKRVHRLSVCLPSSVMPRFDATRVHFIYITTAVSQSRCVFIMLSVSPRNYVNGQWFAFAAMILGITSPFFLLFVLFFFFFSTSCYNYHVVQINEIRYFVRADQAGRLSRTRWINNNGTAKWKIGKRISTIYSWIVDGWW